MRIKDTLAWPDSALGRFVKRFTLWRHAFLGRVLSTLYERPMELMPHNAVVPAVGVVLWVTRESGPHAVLLRQKRSGSTLLKTPMATYDVTYFEREDRVKSLLMGLFGGVFAKTLPLDTLTMDRVAAVKHVFLDDDTLGYISCDVALWVVGVQSIQLDLMVLPPETDVVLVPLQDVLTAPRAAKVAHVSGECVAAVARHLPKITGGWKPNDDADDRAFEVAPTRGRRVLN